MMARRNSSCADSEMCEAVSIENILHCFMIHRLLLNSYHDGHCSSAESICEEALDVCCFVRSVLCVVILYC